MLLSHPCLLQADLFSLTFPPLDLNQDDLKITSLLKKTAYRTPESTYRLSAQYPSIRPRLQKPESAPIVQCRVDYCTDQPCVRCQILDPSDRIASLWSVTRCTLSPSQTRPWRKSEDQVLRTVSRGTRRPPLHVFAPHNQANGSLIGPSVNSTHAIPGWRLSSPFQTITARVNIAGMLRIQDQAGRIR